MLWYHFLLHFSMQLSTRFCWWYGCRLLKHSTKSNDLLQDNRTFSWTGSEGISVLFCALSAKHCFPPLLSFRLFDKLLTLSYFLIRISLFSNRAQRKYNFFKLSNSLKRFFDNFQQLIVQNYNALTSFCLLNFVKLPDIIKLKPNAV